MFPPCGDVTYEISTFLSVSASMMAVCRAFRAAIHHRRSVAVTVTGGRVRVGQQFGWMRRHAAGVQRLRLRCAVNASLHHDRGLLRAVGTFAHLRSLDLAAGDATLPLSGLVALIGGPRLPELASLRLDLSFRSDTAPLDERFWGALLRLRSVVLIAEKPDDFTDGDAAALGRCAPETARWTEFRASLRHSGVTAAGVGALTAGLRRCPVLESVYLDHSYGPLDDGAAAVAAGPLARLPGLRRISVVAESDGSAVTEAVRWPADLADRPEARDLRLSLAYQRVDARTAVLPRRLTYLRLDLCACTGIAATGGWDRIASAVAAASDTLTDLHLLVGDNGLDDGTTAALCVRAVRPLRRLRRIALELSDNRDLTDAAVAAAIGCIPPDVESVRMILNGLPGVGVIDLGALRRCTAAELCAGFSGGTHGLLRVVPPPAVERLELCLAGTRLAGPVVFPPTVRQLRLDVAGVRTPPGAFDGPTVRLPRCRRLAACVHAADAAAVRWVAGLADPAGLESCEWSGRIAVDLVASLPPPCTLALNLYHADLAPGSPEFAAIRGALRRACGPEVGVRLDALAPPAALAELLAAAAAAAPAVGCLSVEVAGPIAPPAAAAAVAAAMHRLAVVRSAAPGTGLHSTLLHFDASVAGAFAGGGRSIRKISSMRGVTVYTTLGCYDDDRLFRLSANHLTVSPSP